MENSIVIFDEAHNIESIAADVPSFECDLAVLENAVEELRKILDSSEKAEVCGVCFCCLVLLSVLQLLMNCLTRLVENVKMFADLKQDELVWGGKEILALLEFAGITTEKVLKELFDTLGEFLSAAEDKDSDVEEGIVKFFQF